MELRDWLQRLDEYTQTLSNQHNSLKAHVIYQRLQLEAQENRYDRSLWHYLEILNRFHMSTKSGFGNNVLGKAGKFKLCLSMWDHQTIGDDQIFVREGLLRLLAQERNPRAFAPFIDGDFYSDSLPRHTF